MRGFAVYSDPNKGNCFACHYNGAGLGGSQDVHRLYLCGDWRPAQQGHSGQPQCRLQALGICDRPDHPRPASAQYCGMFKTPTLRNVATRSAFSSTTVRSSR
jgi:cytochrome c peroxidase